MPDTKNSEPVGIRELYLLLLKQNEERYAMERRIVDRIETLVNCLSPVQTQVENHAKEIDRLRSRSDVIDVIVAIGSAIGATIAGILGTRQ